MPASTLRILVLSTLSCGALLASHPAMAAPADQPTPAQPACSGLLQQNFLRLQDEKPQSLCQYSGKVVVVVNTASFCGFTPQYDGLQKVQDNYARKGFTVVGVPSGDFKGQEYGSNGEIAGFCKAKGVKFPLAEKSDVVGPGTIPIYRWAAARLGPDNAPKWNFHKYLIGRDGKLIAAFGSKTEPSDPKVTQAIEAALARRS